MSTSLIKSAAEGLIEQMGDTAEAAFAVFRDAVRPIYGVGKKGEPAHIGSCFFLKSHGRRYVITAAHVLEHAKKTQLLIPVAEKFGQLDGHFFRTSSLGSVDRIDFAWAAAADAFFPDQAAGGCIDAEQISLNRADDEKRVYMLVGFPRSKNKKANPISRKVRPKILHYFSNGKSVPAVSADLVGGGVNHIQVDYRGRMKFLSGGSENAYGLRGLSGGPVFDLGPLTPALAASPANLFPARLSGIMIEHDEEYRVAIATKIGLLLDEMNRLPASDVAEVKLVEI